MADFVVFSIIGILGVASAIFQLRFYRNFFCSCKDQENKKKIKELLKNE